MNEHTPTPREAEAASESEPDIFPVPTPPAYRLGVYLALTLMAGLLAWLASGGYGLAAVLAGALLVPFVGLYWFMLVLSPRRCRVLVGDEGLVIETPPYGATAILWSEVRRVFLADLAVEPRLVPLAKVSGTAFGRYKVGVYTTQDNATLRVLSSQGDRGRVVALDTAEGYVLLGPADPDALATAIDARMGQ